MKKRYFWLLFAVIMALPQFMDAKNKKEVCIQLYSVRDIINEGKDVRHLFENGEKLEFTIDKIEQPYTIACNAFVPNTLNIKFYTFVNNERCNGRLKLPE